jgi:choline dehydrogenase
MLEKKCAVGVTMIRNGKKETARARKEVILSAGAINTPQILMLSGIGPRAHLEAMKVQSILVLQTFG